MSTDLTCPSCGAGERDIIGHEVRGVYDGVLYWSCALCKLAWNRWDESYGRRHETAQHLVQAWNDTVQKAKLETLDGG